MNKLFVIILILFIPLSLFSKSKVRSTNEYLEGQFYGSKSISYYFISSFISHKLKSNFGIWNYSQLDNENWFESLTGMNYTFRKDNCNLELGSGLGIERWCKKPRADSYFILTHSPNGNLKKALIISGDLEWLGSGSSWTISCHKQGITKNLSLGLSAQSDATAGPLIDFVFGKVDVWTVPGYHLVSKELGIQFGLGIDLY